MGVLATVTVPSRERQGLVTAGVRAYVVHVPTFLATCSTLEFDGNILTRSSTCHKPAQTMVFLLNLGSMTPKSLLPHQRFPALAQSMPHPESEVLCPDSPQAPSQVGTMLGHGPWARCDGSCCVHCLAHSGLRVHNKGPEDG